MTEQDLNTKLNEYSPFQFEGGNESYVFDNGALLINGTLYDYYKIKDTSTGLKIDLAGLIPFHQNVLIDFGEETELCVIVNHEGDKLIEYPYNSRHKAAVEGFFVLKSLKADH